MPVLLVLALAASRAAEAQPSGSAVRGAVLFAAARCGPCHTDTAGGGAWLAGGRPIKTRFGTFYAPNITPDRRYGIGTWSDADFIRAMRKGVSPGGSDYYPAFPYPAFTLMADRDLLDIKAYLFSQPAVEQANRPHALYFPYSLRFLVVAWKILYLREGPFAADPERDEAWNRGAYLAKAVSHCGECHTPRNAMGAPDKRRRLAGVADPPDGLPVPDITPDDAALGRWSLEDLAILLKDGVTPNGDFVRGAMADVVHGTAALSDEDRHAIAVYVKSVPAIPPPPPRTAAASPAP